MSFCNVGTCSSGTVVFVSQVVTIKLNSSPVVKQVDTWCQWMSYQAVILKSPLVSDQECGGGRKYKMKILTCWHCAVKTSSHWL